MSSMTHVDNRAKCTAYGLVSRPPFSLHPSFSPYTMHFPGVFVHFSEKDPRKCRRVRLCGKRVPPSRGSMPCMESRGIPYNEMGWFVTLASSFDPTTDASCSRTMVANLLEFQCKDALTLDGTGNLFLLMFASAHARPAIGLPGMGMHQKPCVYMELYGCSFDNDTLRGAVGLV